MSKYGVPLQEINPNLNLFDGESIDSDSTGLIIRELYEIYSYEQHSTTTTKTKN